MGSDLKATQKTTGWMTAVRRLAPANRPCSRRRSSGGFTLVELLIVTAIIGTIFAIAVPAYNSYIKKAQLKLIIEDLKAIEKRLRAFDFLKNRLPETLAEADIDMIDQWGNAYQYTLIRGKPLTGPGKVVPRKDKNLHPLNSDFDLYSMGPDGNSQVSLTAQASWDDIIRAGDGSFYGEAVDY